MKRRMTVGLGIVLMMAIGCWLLPSKVLALTNEERIQMLDDKFIKGEISEETYKRLLEKYKGTVSSSKPKAEAKPVKEVAGNLVKNFSFEELNSDNLPEGWQIEHKGSNNIDIGVSRTKAHGGNNCVFFFGRGLAWQEKMIQELPLKPGKKYKVIFWARGENLKRGPTSDGAPCVVNLDYKTKDGKLKPLYIEPKVGNEWKMVAKILKVPADALEGGYICLRLYCATGTLWIDDVVVAPLP